jgi:hypothetical protein
MLIITLHNKETDERGYSNYDYKVYINRSLIASGQVIGHKRTDGWQKLVKLMLKQDRSYDRPS